jgi:hypothetical protein
MEGFLSVIIDVVIVVFVVLAISKRNKKGKEASSMPAGQRKQGKYVTYNKKSFFNESGAQPHVHETKKYKSMSDASKLPPGYILLNGEPVRVADLEGK